MGEKGASAPVRVFVANNLLVAGVTLETKPRCAGHLRKIKVLTTIKMVVDIFNELSFTVSVNLKMF